MDNKEYIIISDFNIRASNRGTAALGYGSLSFLQERGFLHEGQKILNIRTFKNPLRKINRHDGYEVIEINGIQWEHITINIFWIEVLVFLRTGIILPYSRLRIYLKKTAWVAAINGGDGFSDIYGTKMFLGRLTETLVAMRAKIPLILLPQTIGPFTIKKNYLMAEKILQYSEHVYVRDTEYLKVLDKIGVKYEQVKDLSYYMKPESWDIEIKPNAVGLNISGLAYSNNFRSLAGQFENYPLLIAQLIKLFRSKGCNVYLIPHSYNYEKPDENNDDMEACREVYERLDDKTGIIFIDKDLISPQIKYLVSKMSFFVGTRMHANFAAIFTGVPVFGLAYSYKFQGAFEANGYDSKKYIFTINNIGLSDVENVIRKVDNVYSECVRPQN